MITKRCVLCLGKIADVALCVLVQAFPSPRFDKTRAWKCLDEYSVQQFLEAGRQNSTFLLFRPEFFPRTYRRTFSHKRITISAGKFVSGHTV